MIFKKYILKKLKGVFNKEKNNYKKYKCKWIINMLDHINILNSSKRNRTNNI